MGGEIFYGESPPGPALSAKEPFDPRLAFPGAEQIDPHHFHHVENLAAHAWQVQWKAEAFEANKRRPVAQKILGVTSVDVHDFANQTLRFIDDQVNDRLRSGGNSEPTENDTVAVRRDVLRSMRPKSPQAVREEYKILDYTAEFDRAMARNDLRKAADAVKRAKALPMGFGQLRDRFYGYASKEVHRAIGQAVRSGDEKQFSVGIRKFSHLLPEAEGIHISRLSDEAKKSLPAMYSKIDSRLEELASMRKMDLFDSHAYEMGLLREVGVDVPQAI